MEIAMPRLTITLSDEHDRALREAALRQNKSLGQIVRDSLDCYSGKSSARAAALVARARAAAGLDDVQATALAIQETRIVREQRT